VWTLIPPNLCPGPRGGPEGFRVFIARDASSAFSASRRETGETSIFLLRVEITKAMHAGRQQDVVNSASALGVRISQKHTERVRNNNNPWQENPAG
jgi:hypothetical protein